MEEFETKLLAMETDLGIELDHDLEVNDKLAAAIQATLTTDINPFLEEKKFLPLSLGLFLSSCIEQIIDFFVTHNICLIRRGGSEC
jgi:hypothetical protein